jgi:hypothetical protein
MTQQLIQGNIDLLKSKVKFEEVKIRKLESKN